ncbi:MAG: hypothetical protein U1D55_09340 [Phycisphaerae bacterium]
MNPIVSRLSGLRRVFTPAADQRRRRLLAAAVKARRQAPDTVAALHDEALFLCAYPSSPQVRRLAQRVLRFCTKRAALISAGRLDGDAAGALDNTGIAGTPVVFSPSLDLARWMTRRFPRHVGVEWDDEASVDSIERLLARLLSVEVDGFRDEGFSTREWFQRAEHTRTPSGLRTLLALLAELGAPPPILDAAFESLELHVRWRLERHGDSRTWLRFPPCEVFSLADGLQREVDCAAVLARPLPRAAALGAAERRNLVDVARATLAVRSCETDAITYADPREVTLFRLERGFDVAILGMQPARRLPIESYFGYVAARNRVPIAYGGGWVFCGRCEIGVNLFPEFRGGESALIFAQILRTYARHFRVRRFLVDPFQFGADNEDAIRSGAFWLYYRLGFRPLDAALNRLAEREAARSSANAGYRSSPRTLRRLAGGPVFLDVPGGDAAEEFACGGSAPSLAAIGRCVTQWIGRRFGGDRRAALACAVAAARRITGLHESRLRGETARTWFSRLAPIVALLPGVDDWTRAERAELGRIILAKGGPRERDYAMRLSRHARLRQALARMAESAAHFASAAKRH